MVNQNGIRRANQNKPALKCVRYPQCKILVSQAYAPLRKCRTCMELRTNIYFLVCLSFSHRDDFKRSCWSCLHQNSPSYVWLDRVTPPQRWREKKNPFLGPPSGLTQALSGCSDAGIKAHKFHYFSVGLFIFCGFLGYFTLSILATDSYIVSGCFTLILRVQILSVTFAFSMLFHGTVASTSLLSSRLWEE